jgi:hypothetical protein
MLSTKTNISKRIQQGVAGECAVKALIRMKTHKEPRALCQDSKADPPRGKTTDIPFKRDERAKTQL